MEAGHTPAFILKMERMQLQLWDNNEISNISFEDLLQAYFKCRSNKRNTANALKFELDYKQYELLSRHHETLQDV